MGIPGKSGYGLGSKVTHSRASSGEKTRKVRRERLKTDRHGADETYEAGTEEGLDEIVVHWFLSPAVGTLCGEPTQDWVALLKKLFSDPAAIGVVPGVDRLILPAGPAVVRVEESHAKPVRVRGPLNRPCRTRIGSPAEVLQPANWVERNRDGRAIVKQKAAIAVMRDG